MVRLFLFFRHLTRIHPECLPNMPVGVLEVTAVHEAMVIRVNSLLASCSDRFLEKCIDFRFRVELERIEDFGGRMGIGDRFLSEKIRAEPMGQEHDAEGIIPDHPRSFPTRKLRIERESDGFIEGSRFREIGNGEINVEFCHKKYGVGMIFIRKEIVMTMKNVATNSASMIFHIHRMAFFVSASLNMTSCKTCVTSIDKSFRSSIKFLSFLRSHSFGLG